MTLGHYEDGIRLLDRSLVESPDGRHAGRAVFFIGKAELGLGRLEAARAAFERVRRDFPGTLEAHKARYKLALIDLLDGDADAAATAFRGMAEQPDGPLAPEAAAMARYLADQRDE